MWKEDDTVQTESPSLVSENDSTALDRCFDVAVDDGVTDTKGRCHSSGTSLWIIRCIELGV
jgi:hypothetical protein